MFLQTAIAEIRRTVGQEFVVEDFWVENGKMVFYVKPPLDTKQSFLKVETQLASLGFVPFLRSQVGRLSLIVASKPPITPSRWVWNLLLFVATIGTTIYIGYQMSSVLVTSGFMEDPWPGALTFSAAVIGILGCHELGHKFMAMKKGIEASLPYFIPVPAFIGTFGAIIRTKNPAPNRDALFDLGAAGPITGFLVLLPFTILGLEWSYPVSMEALPPGTISLPTPLLFNLLYWFVRPAMLEGSALLFHPVAFAAWVGMLVTMLNLMPAGMLDGGHVTRALLGERWHQPVSFLAALATMALGFWYMALLMLFLAFSRHTGPLDDVSNLSLGRKLTSVGIFAILILCAVPGWRLM